MRKVYCNNWLAKVLLAFSSCHTITIGPFVLSKRSEERITQEVRNHECTHARQWVEMAVASGVILLALVLAFGVSPWWMLLSGVVFYVWYGIEYFIRLCTLRNSNKAYKAVAFEREAYENDSDANYLENSNYFAWINYL